MSKEETKKKFEAIDKGGKAVKEYNLYAIKTEDLEKPSTLTQYRFRRITRDYVLVYTSEYAPEHYKKIEAGLYPVLSPTELEWLAECTAKIIAENMANQEKETGNITKTLDRIEKALEEEKQRLETE